MKELSDLEVHLYLVMREDLSRVTLRLSPKLKNQSCKDMTERVSDKGNGPEKASDTLIV